MPLLEATICVWQPFYDEPITTEVAVDADPCRTAFRDVESGGDFFQGDVNRECKQQ